MPNFEDDYAAYIVAQEDTTENRLAYREMLAADVEEFYNTCHDLDGTFCEGPDGPGRVRDNLEKAEKVLPKGAPTWMKNMLTRKAGQAQKKAANLLPEDAPDFMKNLLKRKVDRASGIPTPAVQRGKAKPFDLKKWGEDEKKATDPKNRKKPTYLASETEEG